MVGLVLPACRDDMNCIGIGENVVNEYFSCIKCYPMHTIIVLIYMMYTNTYRIIEMESFKEKNDTITKHKKIFKKRETKWHRGINIVFSSSRISKISKCII